MKKEKSTNRQIAVWMDHTYARLFEPGATTIRLIQSPFQGKIRTAGEEAGGTQLGNFRSTNNESHKHFRKQNELHAYYRDLEKELLPYDEIFIFGPSTAHNELHNQLLGEKKFSDKYIRVEKGDYITENQMKEAAQNFFDRNRIFNKPAKF